MDTSKIQQLTKSSLSLTDIVTRKTNQLATITGLAPAQKSSIQHYVEELDVSLALSTLFSQGVNAILVAQKDQPEFRTTRPMAEAVLANEIQTTIELMTKKESAATNVLNQVLTPAPVEPAIPITIFQLCDLTHATKEIQLYNKIFAKMITVVFRQAKDVFQNDTMATKLGNLARLADKIFANSPQNRINYQAPVHTLST